MPLPTVRTLYPTRTRWLVNTALLPLKLAIPQPWMACVLPGLSTNQDIRIGLVKLAARGRLLDVGCGNNRLAREYRVAGGDAIGIDVHPWPGIDALIGDSGKLPFPDRSFDTVSFVACLNHIPNREQALAEARRVLRDDGQLLLTNLHPFVSRIWHAMAWWDFDQNERGMKDGERWGFTSAELDALLIRCGWRVVERMPFSMRLNALWLCRKAY